MQNLQDTILSQYANSPVITSMIGSINESIDPQNFVQDFLVDVMDVTTCKVFALNAWARIVNLDNFIYYPRAGNFFGFATSDNAWKSFNQAPFSTSDPFEYDVLQVDTPTFRQMVISKAMSNIMAATIPNINKVLMQLLSKSGQAYCYESSPMDLVVSLNFEPTDLQRYMILYSNILPRPAGVSISIETNIPFENRITWGQNYNWGGPNSEFGAEVE